MDPIQIRPLDPGGHERCSYCHGDVTPDEHAVCAGCNAPYHRDCLRDELGACGIRGCGRAVEGARADGQGPIRVRLRGDQGPRVGEERPCSKCGTAFEIRRQARYQTLCSSCHTGQLLLGLFIVGAAFTLYLAIALLS